MSIITDLVLYYKHNEASYNGTAGEVIDNSDTANNPGVAVNSATTTASGKISRGADYSGNSNAYINCGSGSELQNAIVGDISISAWINTSSVANAQNLFMNNSSGNLYSGIFQITAAGNVAFFHRNSATQTDLVTSTGTVSTGSYVHIGWRISGTAVTLYINGSPSGSGTLNNTREYISGIFTTGGNNNIVSLGINGFVDELVIYNAAKTDQDFLDLYNGGDGQELEFDTTPPTLDTPETVNTTNSADIAIKWGDPVAVDFDYVEIDFNLNEAGFGTKALLEDNTLGSPGTYMKFNNGNTSYIPLDTYLLRESLSGLSIGEKFQVRARARDLTGNISNWTLTEQIEIANNFTVINYASETNVNISQENVNVDIGG